MASYQSPDVLSVSELTDQIKQVLESRFPEVWVSGEISNLARPQSGHVYLTLKDESAQIRGVIWRGAASKLPFELQDGLEVVCQATLDVYPPRGSYQLVIRQLEPRGVGALQLAFRQLHAKLAQEGLFDPDRKQVLPRFPKRIAVVTSPTGAAIRDFLEVLRRRWAALHVVVIPARVQGEGAADEIAQGIRFANRLAERPDVLMVGRGGGSLEDLWCFNEEPVVRAISQSTIPVVSAVGHEIDVTLADLVADVRAATPTEAAERIAPQQEEILAMLQQIQRRLTGALRGRAADAHRRLEALANHPAMRRPMQRIHDRARYVDELEMRMQRAVAANISRTQERLSGWAARLETLSPLTVLSRGYSLTVDAQDHSLIDRVDQVQISQQIETQLASGRITSRVEEIHADPPAQN